LRVWFLSKGVHIICCLILGLFFCAPVYLQKTYSEPTTRVIINGWEETYDQVYNIGWDKTKVVVFTSANIFSNENYVKAFLLNTKEK
jgi:hypothetical protein